MTTRQQVFLYNSVAWAAALSVVVASGSNGGAEPRCPASGIVIVSMHDESKLEKSGTKLSVEDYDGLDLLLQQLYPSITISPYNVPEIEMPFALERGVFDAAAYSCNRILSDPEGFFNQFQGLRVWVLTEGTEGGPHLEPTEVTDYLS